MSSLTARLDLRTVTVTVMQDLRNTALDAAYLGSLRHYCERAGYDLVIRENMGLRRMWLEAIKLIRRRFVLMVEHDWNFGQRNPALIDMVRVMAARPDINYIRLNKRINVAVGIDHMLIQSVLGLKQNLTGVLSFSNNPCLMRAGALREIISPMISGSDAHDTENMGAGGVEENVLRRMRQLTRWIGPVATQSAFGTYLLGQPGAGPFIEHLGR